MAAIQVVLGKKMEVEQLGKTTVSKSYTAVRALDALDKAAGNQGGAGALLAGGIGLGVGAGIGSKVGGILSEAINTTSGGAGEASPPIRSAEDRLAQLQSLLDKRLINEQEYAEQKNKIINSL
jgi:membrane protease subunit (stomatin/prohibitin family)